MDDEEEAALLLAGEDPYDPDLELALLEDLEGESESEEGEEEEEEDDEGEEEEEGEGEEEEEDDGGFNSEKFDDDEEGRAGVEEIIRRGLQGGRGRRR